MKFLKWLNRKAYNAKCHLIEFKNFILCRKVETEINWGRSIFYVPPYPETVSEFELKVMINEMLNEIINYAVIEATVWKFELKVMINGMLNEIIEDAVIEAEFPHTSSSSDSESSD